MRSLLRALAVAVTLLVASGLLSRRLVAQVQARPFDVEHVPHGAFARAVAFGQRGLLSDVYWLATVQYIGEPRADHRGWEKLHPLVDLVTDLDPRHGYAYQTAGIVLSSVGRLDESNAILEKGLAKGPPFWTFPYYLAFNHWFYLGDYATAARYAEIAARTPGASANVSHLAVSLASKGGTPQDAVDLLQQLRHEVKDEATAARLDEQLKLAILERDAQALERAVANWESRTGLPLGSLDQLVVGGVVSTIPPDPFGGRYVWNAKERKVHSTANPFRFLPAAPGRAARGFRFDRQKENNQP
jgi:tetratricopeptide (TPR) repeat protein